MSKENKERIFKLIDREGYLENSNLTQQIITDIGIVVNEDVYFKGDINRLGDLVRSDYCRTMIFKHEFKYFEEVGFIPKIPEKETEENIATYSDDPTEIDNNIQHTISKVLIDKGLDYSYISEGSNFSVYIPITDKEYTIKSMQDLEHLLEFIESCNKIKHLEGEI